MAAAPAEDPSPLATPDLPPAKRKPATASWSLLPPDLVRSIADCFLATNDVDCYMEFRAVCPSWRAATDDPRKKISDPRFQPRRWIILDDVVQNQGKLLMLNTDSGRFLRKKLPLLRDHYVVATTPSGVFVLANRSPPHAACLFNPLTGVLTRFVAPVPPDARVATVGYNKDDSLAILLFGDSSCKIYTAAPDSEGFTAKENQQGVYHFFRNAVVGGAYSHISGSGSAFIDVDSELLDLLRSIHGDPVKFFCSDYPSDSNGVHCFLVGLAAHVLLFIKAFGHPFVFKMNTEVGKIEPVQSISTFAIFIGHCRCLSVDTNKFRGIEANCIYYTEHLGSSARIRKYKLKDRKEEVISETAEFVKQDKQFVLVADRPSTIIQLLCSYTINNLDSQLAFQQML